MRATTALLAAATNTSIPGEFVVYVIFPLIVVSVVAAGTWARKISSKQNEHGQALALLLADVSPPRGLSLREMVQAHTVQLATIETQLEQRQIPVAHLPTTAPGDGPG